MSTISASTTSTTAFKVTSDTTGTLVLQTGASPTTAVTVDGSQRVGIGTSSPTRLLHVQATGTGNVATFQSNAGPNLAFVGTESSGRTYLIGEGLVTAGNFSIYDSTASAERLVVDSSGRLGLGLTTPSYILDVGSTGTSNTVNINGTASVLRFAGSSYGQVASTTALYLDAASGQSVIFRPNGSAEAGRFNGSGALVFQPVTTLSSPTSGTWYTVYTMNTQAVYLVTMRTVRASGEQSTTWIFNHIVGGLWGSTQLSNYTIGSGDGNSIQSNGSSALQVQVNQSGTTVYVTVIALSGG